MAIANFLILVILFLGVPIIAGGVIRKVRARCQNRKGPSILQSFYDATRLLHKTPIDSNASDIFSKVSPPMALFSAIVLWSIVVFEWAPFILIPFFVALQRMSILTYSMQTGTSFGGLGATRETLLSLTNEPILLLIILVAQSKLQLPFSIETLILGALLFACSSLIVLVESAKPPFDDPRTHLELTMVHEAMLLEASGQSIALFSIAADLKMVSLIVFIIRLSIEHSKLIEIPAIFQNIILFFGIIASLVLMGFWEAISVRRKWKWIPEIMGLTFLLILILGTMVKLN